MFSYSKAFFYYQCRTHLKKKILKNVQKIQSIFNRSYQPYGTRRIRKALSNQGIIVSRRDVAQCAEVVKQDKQRAVYWYKKRRSKATSLHKKI